MKTSHLHAAFILLATAAVALLCAPPARATTLTVNSGADSGGTCPGADCTLRQAIATSVSGDKTINFSANVTKISLTSAELRIENDLTISGPGPGLLEVTRASGANFRIFNIVAAVSISGIAITNGHPTPDPAVGDYAYGGAIFNFSNLSVTNCIISGNTAAAFGGGICSFGRTLTVSACTLSNNLANGAGGGIYNENGTMIVTNSTLNGNSYIQSGDTYAYGGGGISIRNSEATVSNCTLNGNSAATTAGIPRYGGGIVNVAYQGNSTLTVRKCTLSGNSALDGGGGIANQSNSNNAIATLTVSNSTVSGNSVGGIYNSGSNGGNAFVQLSNTILYSTSGDPGANLVNIGLGTSITSEGYNLSSDNGGGFLTATGDQINTDPKLGPLQDNGGPTLTRALLVGSPALDKGKNFGVTTDQRGLPRPIDIPSIPNASGGDGSDIGAVEMQAAPAFVVTTLADHDDGTCSPDDCTLREAINAANATVGADTITFASGLTGTIILGPGLGTLTVTDSVTITGPGARVLAVSGNNVLRVFYFNSGANVMSGLTIRNGAATAAAGTGIGTAGGGVFNSITSTLYVTNCSFSNNHVQGADNATAASVGGRGWGGGIGNSGVVTLIGCTLSGNGAAGGRGGDGSIVIGGNVHGGNGGDGLGGAIFNDTNARLEIVNSTVATNSATGGAGGNGQFGGNGGNATAGVFNQGTMTVTAATLTGNAGAGGARGTGSNMFTNGNFGLGRGGLTAGGGMNGIRNTVSAGNTGDHNGGPDVGGTFTSEGYNLIGIGDSSTGFNATADQVGTGAAPINAMLGSLQDNGGSTNTVGLLTGSPAVDKGKSFGLTTDQRGLSIFDDPAVPNAAGGDARDIGAFELNGGPPLPTILANISTRLRVETGDNVLIGGFIITGTQPKRVIVRAIGPSLPLAGALTDPVLELRGPGSFATITNDNWRSTQEAEIIATTIPPSNDLESAIVATLPANNSAYTAIVRGVNNGTGIGVVEAYDLDRTVNSKLANISTRGLVQTGDNVLIGGLIVLGQNPLRVIVRAMGPSLPLPGALGNPTLELRDGNGALIASNDNWRSDQEAEIIATGIPPSNNLESAIVRNLTPGNYTAIVRGVNNTTGVALVEVYALN